MTGCLAWLILLGFAIFAMVSIIRWFEQITDAVDARSWNRVMLLVMVPLTVWLFPSKVSASRPSAVPHHDPVRGFGAGPAMPADAGEDPPRPRASRRSPVDPEAAAKLRRKMKEQGMLGGSDQNE